MKLELDKLNISSLLRVVLYCPLDAKGKARRTNKLVAKCILAITDVDVADLDLFDVETFILDSFCDALSAFSERNPALEVVLGELQTEVNHRIVTAKAT